MALQALMQGRPRQTRERGLQCVKAIVERQECLTPECYHHRLLLFAKHRRAWLRWPGRPILDRLALAPFRDGLEVYAELPAQLRERSLRWLYCCSDGVRGRGAPVTNLSQSATFHSCERITPSNRGIKHLGFS